LQGDLHGSSQGETVVKNVMSDEKVDVGEKVITSGGDKIYPKGLPVGAVTAVNSDPDKPLFLSITVKPATNLNRLEEVLVVTKMTEELPNASQVSGPIRAADILAQRLPTVPKLPEKATDKPSEKTQEKKPHEKPGSTGASTQPEKPTPGGPANQAKKLVDGTNSDVTEKNKSLVPKAPKTKKPAADQSPQATPPEATKPDKPETGPPPSNGEKPPE
jgi:rod shape-determining protein MreC